MFPTMWDTPPENVKEIPTGQNTLIFLPDPTMNNIVVSVYNANPLPGVNTVTYTLSVLPLATPTFVPTTVPIPTNPTFVNPPTVGAPVLPVTGGINLPFPYWVFIIIGVAGIAIIVAIILGVLYIRKRKKNNKKTPSGSDYKKVEQKSSSSSSSSSENSVSVSVSRSKSRSMSRSPSHSPSSGSGSDTDSGSDSDSRD